MGQPLILCMKWGTRYGAEYVNRLYSMCVRGMAGQPFEFICFTDDAAGLVKGVDARPLPSFEGVPQHLAVKPWRKLCLWKSDLGKDLTGRNALVLDVDVVITGELKAFFDFEPVCDFVVWRNPTKPNSGVGNTSVFRFKVGSHPEIYQRFVDDPVGVWEREFRIEQELIAARLGDGTAARTTGLRPEVAADPFYVGLNVMRYWPTGWCVSFKENVLPAWPMRLWRDVPLPPAVKVVVFHGKPDPDEALRGEWPAVWWKRWYKYIKPVGWIGEYWK